jgi:integral membrane protein
MDQLFDIHSVEGALARYRILAVIVGISIAILVFIALPLKIAGSDTLARDLGFPHGAILYPLYIILTLDLARRIRMHPLWAIVAVIVGTVPVVSFYAERRITAFVRERQAALAEVAAAV